MNTTAITIKSNKPIEDYANNTMTKKRINRNRIEPVPGAVKQPIYTEKCGSVGIILYGYPKLYTEKFNVFFTYFLSGIVESKTDKKKYALLDAAEYNQRGFKSVHEARRELLNGIETLRCTELSCMVGDKEVVTPIITDRYIDHKQGKIQVRIHDSFAANLLFTKGSFNYPFPISLFSADLKKYPYIVPLSKKLIQDYKLNILNENRRGFLSVLSLLEFVGGKPATSNPHRHRDEQTAIRRLEETLNALTYGDKASTDNNLLLDNTTKLKEYSDTIILKSWDYSTNEKDANGDRLPLPDNEQSMRFDSEGKEQPLPYDMAINRYIHYELTDEWIKNLEEYRKRKKKARLDAADAKKERDSTDKKLEQMTIKERAKIRAEKAEGIRK